jgi:hypothetical protein
VSLSIRAATPATGIRPEKNSERLTVRTGSYASGPASDRFTSRQAWT